MNLREHKIERLADNTTIIRFGDVSYRLLEEFLNGDTTTTEDVDWYLDRLTFVRDNWNTTELDLYIEKELGGYWEQEFLLQENLDGNWFSIFHFDDISGYIQLETQVFYLKDELHRSPTVSMFYLEFIDILEQWKMILIDHLPTQPFKNRKLNLHHINSGKEGVVIRFNDRSLALLEEFLNGDIKKSTTVDYYLNDFYFVRDNWGTPELEERIQSEFYGYREEEYMIEENLTGHWFSIINLEHISGGLHVEDQSFHLEDEFHNHSTVSMSFLEFIDVLEQWQVILTENEIQPETEKPRRLFRDKLMSFFKSLRKTENLSDGIMDTTIKYKNTSGNFITIQQTQQLESFEKHTFVDGKLKKVEKFWEGEFDSGKLFLESDETYTDFLGDSEQEKYWDLYTDKVEFNDYTIWKINGFYDGELHLNFSKMVLDNLGRKISIKYFDENGEEIPGSVKWYYLGGKPIMIGDDFEGYFGDDCYYQFRYWPDGKMAIDPHIGGYDKPYTNLTRFMNEQTDGPLLNSMSEEVLEFYLSPDKYIPDF